MMWEEKIEMLKKDFSPQEFHVPFTDWSDILKKIESKFIVKQDATYFLMNWIDNLKSKHFIQSIDRKALLSNLKELDESQSYWFIAVIGDAPTSKQYVYSCSPKAIQSLYSITSNDFFLVDKKLAWFTYFHRTEKKVEIYKSGDAETPFDKAVLH